MVRTTANAEANAEPRVETGAAPPASTNGISATGLKVPPERIRELLANRVPSAFRLKDKQGHCAYVWWERDSHAPVVEADDSGFRRRVLRALKKPIWTVEDERDEYGLRLTTRVLMQPDDPRYPSRLRWRWGQVGLGNLAAIGLVRRDTREPISTFWSVDEGDTDAETNESERVTSASQPPQVQPESGQLST